MMVCGWTTLTSQHSLENDNKRQQICQISMKIASGPPGFSSLIMTHQNRVDHTFWLHLWKNKHQMKTGWTTNSWNRAIWLALSLCHMTMTCKINKLEKPGEPLRIFHALFGRSAAFYGHFQADAVTSEWSTRISHQPLRSVILQSTGKDLTNLQKFLARAAVPFLFRCSLPLFRHDSSIFLSINALSIKFIPDELQ